MSCNQIHVNDSGIQLKVTVYDCGTVVNVSGATNTISIRKPNGTKTDYAASLLTDGTDGVIYYTTVSGDLDITGTYKIQATVQTSQGVYHSSVGSFRVKCNI
jgi:hypothetical protein